jgi:hypothetical protein
MAWWRLCMAEVVRAHYPAADKAGFGLPKTGMARG